MENTDTHTQNRAIHYERGRNTAYDAKRNVYCIVVYGIVVTAMWECNL